MLKEVRFVMKTEVAGDTNQWLTSVPAVSPSASTRNTG
jgi:hypothetical protein